MKHLGIFMAGFAGGWLVRSSFDSSRSLVVSGVAALYGTVDRVRRAVAMERENLEDLVAEGRAKHQATLRRVRPERDPIEAVDSPSIPNIRAA